MRSYDAIFFTAERSTEELIEVLNFAVQSSRTIIAYIHEDSPAYKDFQKIVYRAAEIKYCKSTRGILLMLNINQPETCKTYVCYHKPYYIQKLPEGYIKIHAGKKNSTVDLQIQGDDTGDNISELNPYLNELTVTYWAWKNTKSDYIGFSHYCRYFVVHDLEDSKNNPNYLQLGGFGDHIPTMNEAKDLLKDYDIEEAFQIFVMHNHLRIKYVQVLFGGHESTENNFNPKNFV